MSLFIKQVFRDMTNRKPKLTCGYRQSMRCVLVLMAFLVLAALMISCEKEKKIVNYTVNYSEPYFAVNLVDKTAVHKEPGAMTPVIYRLEGFRVVRMKASVSLIEPEPVWYHIESSDVTGYVLSKNFKLFESQREADRFLVNKHPSSGLLPSFSLYKLADQDFKAGRKDEAVTKLYRFLELNPKLREEYPTLFHSIVLLIGKIHIEHKDHNKAKVHFVEMKQDKGLDYPVTLFGTGFDPNSCEFYIDEVEKYIKRQAFKQYDSKTAWEVNSYLGYVYELIKDYPRSKKEFLLLLKSREKDVNYKKHKVLYIQFAVDRLAAMTRSDLRFAYLESVLGQ
ncbi:MAG: hypothetical protein OEZ36_12070, partial [Spirochaetota bacterium]|nr:hypothetical protein [Spirochaetota bacterium]